MHARLFSHEVAHSFSHWKSPGLVTVKAYHVKNLLPHSCESRRFSATTIVGGRKFLGRAWSLEMAMMLRRALLLSRPLQGTVQSGGRCVGAWDEILCDFLKRKSKPRCLSLVIYRPWLFPVRNVLTTSLADIPHSVCICSTMCDVFGVDFVTFLPCWHRCMSSIPNIPPVTNEPILDFAPNTPEREAVMKVGAGYLTSCFRNVQSNVFSFYVVHRAAIQSVTCITHTE